MLLLSPQHRRARLLYYGALIPFIGAILVARRAPLLSLGLSFLAGLVRLEYMAVPLVHAVFLVWQRVSQAREQASGRSWLARIGGYSAAAAVWGFNIWTLTCITVWQFHNRVWFAWSQNYAFFRYLTGRDAGGNPWLDHQSIAERDFPGAHSLSEALAANPTAVLEHTWFNLHKLPGYLAQFIVVHQHAGWWRNAPVVVVLLLLGAGAIALVARRPRRDRIVHWLRAHDVEIALCLAGVISAAPGGIVSSKTNYIMALVPAAVGVIAVAHRLAIRSTAGGRWLPRVYGTLTSDQNTSGLDS